MGLPEESAIFASLAAPEKARLRAVAQPRSYQPGQEIFKEGDAGDGLYLLESGQVEISVQVRDSSQVVFTQIRPGDLFGEMAVIENRPRSATAIARQPSTAWFIPRQEMLDLIARSPGLSLALLREVSGRLREFNQRFLQEVLQAERLALVGRFAGSIVHDLKNPLNVIGLTAQMIGMDQASTELRERAIGIIRRQVDRISEMISEVLEFTRGSQPDLVLAPIDYAAFLRHVTDELRGEGNLQSIAFELEEPLPEVRILVHPKRLRRVFHNLAQNAMEAMPDGGRVRIRCALDNSAVVTEFEDSGPGIAPEMTGRLFQPFATHGKSHGTGLGLSICKRIIEDHRGRMSARSEPGHGAVFIFTLPQS